MKPVDCLTSDLAGLRLLKDNCNNYTIHNRDWPRHGFRYEVRCSLFFAYGSGVGYTLEQAAARAINQMNKMKIKQFASSFNFTEIVDQAPAATSEELRKAKYHLDTIKVIRSTCPFCQKLRPEPDDYRPLELVKSARSNFCFDSYGRCIGYAQLEEIVQNYRDLQYEIRFA